jgi:hypothetical protein
LQKFVRYLDQFLDQPTWRERGAYLRKRWGRLRERRRRRAQAEGRPEGAAGQLEVVTSAGYRVTLLQRAIWVCWFKYEPRPSSVRVAQFWTEGSRAKQRESSLGWSAHLEGEFESAPIAGGHFEIFKGPNVRVLAERLRRSLERARLEL